MVLTADRIFNKNADSIQNLVRNNGWKDLSDRDTVAAVYRYIKNSIKFGLLKQEPVPASQVLELKKGGIVSQDILFKTLLDAAGVLSRYRAVFVKKEIYSDLIRPMRFNSLPKLLISSWIEVFLDEKWIIIDGLAFDTAYLDGVKEKAASVEAKEFIGYGLAVFDGQSINDEWTGEHLFFQRAAVTRDLGVIDNFEWFFSEYKKAFQALSTMSGKYSGNTINALRS